MLGVVSFCIIISTIVFIAVCSLMNFMCEHTWNPFYEFKENMKNGGWAMALLIYPALIIMGISFTLKEETKEKAHLKWSYNKETRNIEATVTGTQVEGVIINLDKTQN